MEMDLASTDLNSTESVQLVDTDVLVNYISQLCVAAFNAGSEMEFQSLESAKRVCAKFISDPSHSVLFITFTRALDNDNKHILHIDTRLAISETTGSQMIVAIKCNEVLVHDKQLGDQVQTVTMPSRFEQNEEPFEVLHSLVHLAIGPYFDAWASNVPRSSGGVEATDTRKKITDLENSLLHLRNHSEVPHFILELHPEIDKLMGDHNIMLDTTNLKFLNELQNYVNNWIKQVQSITKLSRDPTSGTASQEIEFWISMEKELLSVMGQLSSRGVELTLQILRDAKRYHATVSFLSDTGITEALEKVEKYNQLMKLLPLESLVNADSLESTKAAIFEIFTHINKRLKTVPYPVWRALALVGLISRDLDSTIRRILLSCSPMKLAFPNFVQLNTSLHEVFDTWDSSVKEFINIAREMTRKRAEKFIPMRVNAEHQAIKDRFALVLSFRERHHEMEQTLAKVGQNSQHNHFQNLFGDVSLSEDINDAYSLFNNIDILDTSESGVNQWNRTEKLYNERTNRIEQGIISMLRESLATAKTSREMFSVFSTFNALFVRPAIRGAIHEYQARLIDSVKSDITKLQSKFRLQYTNSEAYEMAKLRDFPPTASTIMWIQQMDRQLSTSLLRMQDIFGDNWQEYTDGIKLAQETAAFKKKLDTRAIFESWLSTFNSSWQSHIFLGPIFRIQKSRTTFDLAVNFDPSVAVLFKEVRMLSSMGFNIPFSVVNLSREAKRIYHHAVCLIDSVRILTECLFIANNQCKDYEILVYGLEMHIYALLVAGIPLMWSGVRVEADVNKTTGDVESTADLENLDPTSGNSSDFGLLKKSAMDSLAQSATKHTLFVQRFQKSVLLLQNRVDEMVRLSTMIEHLFSKLEDTSVISAVQLSTIINDLQSIVDKLNLGSFGNVDKLVDNLNSRIAQTLIKRGKALLQSWCDTIGINNKEDKAKHVPLRAKLAESPQTLRYELLLRNQVIVLEPPLSEGRIDLIANLHANLIRLTSIPLLDASTYELRRANVLRPTFAAIQHDLLLPLIQAHNAIDLLFDRVDSYLSTWYGFQSLWDLSSNQMYDILGSDIGKWLTILDEIRKSRATFDSNDPFKDIGIIKVDFQSIQVRVDTKYDIWQHDLILKFSQRLNSSMRDVCTDMENVRRGLERSDVFVDSGTLDTLVLLITSIYSAFAKLQDWESSIFLFRQGQTLLSRNRFQFPAKWLYIDQIDNEWLALQDILTKRKSTLDQQTNLIRTKIESEASRVTERVGTLEETWHIKRPISASLSPSIALQSLSRFSADSDTLLKSIEMVGRAADALGLDIELPSASLGLISEEIADLKYVWTSLDTIWSLLQDLRESSWQSVVPRKIRKSLEDFSDDMRNMPARIRQYASFQQLQSQIKNLIKANSLIAELKTEPLQERHWVKLYRMIGTNEGRIHGGVPKTLGQVWDLNLTVNASRVKEILEVAHGEFSLESYLNEVRDFWSSYSLELVDYKNRCRLIRNWDDIFQKSSDNLNSLAAMHHSPYFGVFEETARNWEDRLNRVYSVFDIWLEVQKHWVYLEGIFKSSSGGDEIRQVLPQEFARFHNIDTEFFVVLSAMYRNPLILHVLNIPDIQSTLEHLAQMLKQVQKSLGEFFEQQRERFGRFYFVGDDDILEMISNPNDVYRVEAHLGKMFPGVKSMKIEDGLVSGVLSKEGELLTLHSPVELTPQVIDWLQNLELAIRASLAHILQGALESLNLSDDDLFGQWILAYPCQVLILAVQITWTNLAEEVMRKFLSEPETTGSKSPPPLLHIEELLNLKLGFLADAVINSDSVVSRKKYESLITELIRLRDVTASVDDNPTSFSWNRQIRFRYNSSLTLLNRLSIEHADTSIEYGYEYIGLPDKLVVTPLIDKCFLTMTQALKNNMGGSPFGPAGTGKTETVKSLGQILGRFVLVFCCDESFDFQSIARILRGVSKIGAWTCFDEFNRLPGPILSAVSATVADMLSVTRSEAMNQGSAIFITMNPGYAGRNTLPDNLKRLFRSFFMSKPDKELIVQTLLYSQGFRDAEGLSLKIVPFFDDLHTMLPPQIHYDFGLRALKSVLTISGKIKRADISSKEGDLILRALHETVLPKLVQDDVGHFLNLESTYFNEFGYSPKDSDQLVTAIRDVASERGYTVADSWMNKALQLHRFQEIYQGVMLVGQSGTGKTAVAESLFEAMKLVDGVDYVVYRFDAKVIQKEVLYGTLDFTTREWTDGLFTKTVRRIVENLRGESGKMHWIVFDGDVDPEWIENLNSVLDDNRQLTLPNGERINIPPNLRILFEVENIEFATPATVTRCGMIWFNETIDISHIWKKFVLSRGGSKPLTAEQELSGASTLTRLSVVLSEHLATFHDGLFSTFLAITESMHHVMMTSPLQMIQNFISHINIISSRLEDPSLRLLDSSSAKSYVSKVLFLAVVWAFVGDCPPDERQNFAERIQSLPEFGAFVLPSNVLDVEVSSSGEWLPIAYSIESTTIESHQVLQPDLVIPTVDTRRHESIIYGYLQQHKPVILCGPPGSGKTMTLFSALNKLPSYEVVGLNFSKEASPKLLIQTLEQHCVYTKSQNSTVLKPRHLGKWLVVFCDEINLPALDKYGTQKVISLLRQMIEHGGFWSESSKQWVSLENVQFVGACNPPGDAGRVALSARFLRHTAVVLVDYPGPVSLRQVYSTLTGAALRCIPQLRGFGNDIGEAMVSVYEKTQQHIGQQSFNKEEEFSLVYSPRELTRWVRGLYESIKERDTLSLEELLRIWCHEGLRLFHDRLRLAENRGWTLKLLEGVAGTLFPNVNISKALEQPILYSNWLSRYYLPVNQEELRDFVVARMKTFCEEQIDTPMVLYDELLDHVLRIDRVLRQPQGHLILVGVDSSGRTLLTRFVAWMNGIKVHQLRTSRNYSHLDFDADIRTALKRAGCHGEKTCFIMDESNILETSFIERLNTLLTNGEVPGLFEGDEYTMLISACRNGVAQRGLNLSTDEELYSWFISEVVKNLHIVLTISSRSNVQHERGSHGANVDGSNLSVTTSPALFNRCVVNYMGDWSDNTLEEVAATLTRSLDLDKSDTLDSRMAFSRLAKDIHNSVKNVADTMGSNLQSRSVSPGFYLDFLNTFVNVYRTKSLELVSQQRHFDGGLVKIKDTSVKVRDLKNRLGSQKQHLEAKKQEANDMLRQMLADQNEAERKKVASIEIQKQLKINNKIIADRQEQVFRELSLAEPAVLEAQQSVGNIKKQHLSELRSMANPPDAVKLTLESVCTLLGHRTSSWRDVQQFIRKDDFILSIVNFDNSLQMTPQLRNVMETVYMKLPNYNYETVNRASKACGPLLQWVVAHVNYSRILENIQPLRSQVQELEVEAQETIAKATVISDMIGELESSIDAYSNEYSKLITETQNIKSEMDAIEQKVERSRALIEKLGDEKKRWSVSVRDFEGKLESLAGSCILSAAYLTYCGYFDQAVRRHLFSQWKGLLDGQMIKYDTSLDVSAFLSSVEDRSRWSEIGGDSLWMENAVMMSGLTTRYPYIIDPTGRSIELLKESIGRDKLMVTSFTDASFVKHLESSLRFGTALLILEAEHYDPILGPVLSNEYRKTGGRTLISLGSQDIDFSTNFRLYLHTGDMAVKVPDFISSRTTLVNFTITRNSLQSQSLDTVLKIRRPEIEQKRQSLLRKQSSYNVHLHELEMELLAALNLVEGSILENDTLVDTLERIKTESSDISSQVLDTEEVMATMASTLQHFEPLAKHCSLIFSVLETLKTVHHVYQFSLQFFVDEFTGMLETGRKDSGNDDVDVWIKKLYLGTFKAIRPTLLVKDIPLVWLIFCSCYKSVDLGEFVADDSLFASIRELASSCFGVEEEQDIVDSLQAVVTSTLASTPIALCTSPSNDPTTRLKSITPYTHVIAMGSSESITAGEAAIESASKEGKWVLLQNIQLAPEWLEGLEKKLRSGGFHSDFRLLYSCDLAYTEQIPTTFLQMSRVVTFEQPIGIKNGLISTFCSLPRKRLTALPVERARVYLALSWAHITVRERLRLAPVGWSKSYQFDDSDFENASLVVEDWITAASKGRDNISPDSIPFEAISRLIVDTVYGAKMDNANDADILEKLCGQMMSRNIYDVDFNPTKVTSEFKFPETSSVDGFLAWINHLPDFNSPVCLGLPDTAEKLRLSAEAKSVISYASQILEKVAV